ncbi:hypothetical protein CL673_05480 [Candidatus Bathyarchaeota archaeon]|jgi:hypothetical protein|nr:hypothetical protein [Candidatus Bathyarchaeota archaeon]MDP6048553.1 hypothetical protein [Candidatus Bathyarchaeota archaeon]|tara:strand:+ start:592 stop:933 length:342 start_codon:yes stop_codon:yes gene_type:complete
MSLGFMTGEAEYDKRRLHGEVAVLENAVVAFFWEGNVPRMGTLTVTLPDRNSSSLLGERDRQLGLILGSHLSALTGKMALVSVNLPIGLGNNAGRALLDLARGLIGGEGEEDG